VDTLTPVSRLAERVGLSADTVRYYERVQLLAAAPRNEWRISHLRRGCGREVAIHPGREALGLRLREIRDLLDALDEGLCPCGHIEELITARMSELDAEVARLLALRETLEFVLVRTPRLPVTRKGGNAPSNSHRRATGR
jgi:DNA-binding transcriptional MerR regulator